MAKFFIKDQSGRGGSNTLTTEQALETIPDEVKDDFWDETLHDWFKDPTKGEEFTTEDAIHITCIEE